MRELSYYLELPYTIEVRRDEEGDFVARVQELPGCSAHGSTEHEALDNLQEVKELWISDRLEHNERIPEPEREEERLPSGKWVQRVPRTLHRRLTRLAKREGVSLNQLVTSILAERLGKRETPVESVTLRAEETAYPDLRRILTTLFHYGSVAGWERSNIAKWGVYRCNILDKNAATSNAELYVTDQSDKLDVVSKEKLQA